MTQTPDKLFRDRLEPLQTTPPPDAWNRIHSNLQKQKQRRTRRQVGGIILLLLVASISAIILSSTPPATQSIPAPTPAIDAPPMASISSDPIENTSTAPPEDKQEPVPGLLSKTIQKEDHPHSRAIIASGDRHAGNSSLIQTDETPVEYEIPEPSAVVIEIVAASSAAKNDVALNTGKKIMYSADEVNMRFKRKQKPAVIDTTSTPTSALQKVIDVAYNFKNDNTMLGDLRQMKNDLLSFKGNGPSPVK